MKEAERLGRSEVRMHTGKATKDGSANKGKDIHRDKESEEKIRTRERKTSKRTQGKQGKYIGDV